jgi:hypothetical protein
MTLIHHSRRPFAAFKYSTFAILVQDPRRGCRQLPRTVSGILRIRHYLRGNGAENLALFDQRVALRLDTCAGRVRRSQFTFRLSVPFVAPATSNARMSAGIQPRDEAHRDGRQHRQATAAGHGARRGPLTRGRPSERRFAGCPDPRAGSRSLDRLGSRFPGRGEGEESTSVFRIGRRVSDFRNRVEKLEPSGSRPCQSQSVP